MANQKNEIILKEDNPIDNIDNSETMYNHIGNTLNALETVNIDGYSPVPIPTSLVAQSFKKYLPDSETSMLLSRALPMSQSDLKAIRMKKAFTESMRYRKEQVRMTSLTLAETTGARLRVAYRLCRYMTHLTGIGQNGVPMSLRLGSSNPEINLYDIPSMFDETRGWSRGLASPRKLLKEITDSQYTYTYIIGGELYTSKGMSILPPPLPDQYLGEKPYLDRRDGVFPTNYDPLSDVPLSFYLNIMEFLANHLEIGGGEANLAGGFTGLDSNVETTKNMESINVDDKGAILALLNPAIARLAWPCRDDIETFEEAVLIPYVEELLVQHSQIVAENKLKAEMGLTRAEAVDYIEVAKTYAQQVHNYDPERERSPLVSKLQLLGDECADAGMVTTQLNTIKTICQIFGLTKHDEEGNVDKRAGLRNALEDKFKEEKMLKQAESTE